jgi:hypothetical protein
MMNSNNNVIKVVLFANGIGSNPNTYRPDSDESQWWNRRDALVRCVTAFLFTGNSKPHNNNNNNNNYTNNNNKNGCSKELIILFDEDWSYFSMIYTSPSTQTSSPQTIILPTERNVIQLWKYSSQNPGIRIEQHSDFGLSCLCCTTTTTTILQKTTLTNDMTQQQQTVTTMNINDIHSNNITNPNIHVANNIHDYHKSTHIISHDNNITSNKRTLLEYLQSTCSLEFLRQHKYVTVVFFSFILVIRICIVKCQLTVNQFFWLFILIFVSD